MANTNGKTRKEINTDGINGRGEKVYRVVVINNETGAWVHWDDFDTIEEAETWKKWA